MATMVTMNAEPIDVQAMLDASTWPLRRWESRRGGRGRRPMSTTQLQAAAWGMLDVFEELLMLSCSELSVQVRTYQVPEDEKREAAEEAETIERLNSLLETIRRVRGHFTGSSANALVRALRAREPDLATKFEERQQAALAQLGEWEKLLVFFGAGTEADAHLADDMVPAVREDLAPSSSVSFDS